LFLALFTSAGKKFLAALSDPSTDWKKLRSFSEGSRDKGVSDRSVLSLLMQRACETDTLPLDDFGAILRNLVTSGVDLNSTVGSGGETALQLAVGCDKAPVAEALLLAGASPVAASTGGRTALHIASANGSFAIAEILVGAGSDINAEDSDGNSPLHVAVMRKGNVRLVEFLISQGAVVWARNRDGMTPLRLAIQTDSREYMKPLETALAAHRTKRLAQWFCPSCGGQMSRPVSARIDWLVQLGVWEHISYVCGRCGQKTSSLVLDGER
jgi:hypothetical protein